MKYLIFVRHGKDNFDGELDDEGIRQMDKLSDSLRSVIPLGSRVKLMTSRLLRSRASAKLIMGDLNIYAELQMPEILCFELNQYRPDLDARLNELLRFVESESAGIDVLILVTHSPQMRLFPPYYGREVLGVESFTGDGVGKGEALIIDCEGRTMRKIP